MTSLNNLSGLWGIGSVPSGLGPGSGVIRAVDSDLEFESPIEECWARGSGLADLCLKSVLMGELFTISRNRLISREGSPSGVTRLQM